MYKKNDSNYRGTGGSDRGNNGGYQNNGDRSTNNNYQNGERNNNGYQNGGDRGKTRLRRLDKHKNTDESMSDIYEFVNKLSDLVEHKDTKCTQDIIETESDNFEEFTN